MRDEPVEEDLVRRSGVCPRIQSKYLCRTYLCLRLGNLMNANGNLPGASPGDGERRDTEVRVWGKTFYLHLCRARVTCPTCQRYNTSQYFTKWKKLTRSSSSYECMWWSERYVQNFIFCVYETWHGSGCNFLNRHIYYGLKSGVFKRKQDQKDL